MTAKGKYPDAKTRWVTSDEVAWMEGAGGWGADLQGLGRLEILTRYRKTLDERRKWGLIDSAEVKRSCDAMIRRLRATGK